MNADCPHSYNLTRTEPSESSSILGNGLNKEKEFGITQPAHFRCLGIDERVRHW